MGRLPALPKRCHRPGGSAGECAGFMTGGRKSMPADQLAGGVPHWLAAPAALPQSLAHLRHARVEVGVGQPLPSLSHVGDLAAGAAGSWCGLAGLGVQGRSAPRAHRGAACWGNPGSPARALTVPSTISAFRWSTSFWWNWLSMGTCRTGRAAATSRGAPASAHRCAALRCAAHADTESPARLVRQHAQVVSQLVVGGDDDAWRA